MSENSTVPPVAGQWRPAPPLGEAIDRRRSVPAVQLQAPGPDPATLLRLLASAVRVPDHGKRVPFRFITLQDDARRVFGEKVAHRHRMLDPDTPEALLAKDRDRWLHAPVIVVVVARLGPDAKIPEQERLLTAGCTCLVLLQAAQAAGFGGCWLTGWAAYDRGVAEILGLGADEHVTGFIHLGTPKAGIPERERPDPAALLTRWQP
ncbi:nitroreductase [Lysobacter sp. GX 14042]|uniref:nitroreductase family protein n=1 Tax=Lysobacter sp. GX 14042 TaxID=2907155 RepID=UPI001F378329|nr:nitroreductase [Lysobacter sp. GX 14042]MCE7031063.1 nitroreductase [Lysobacter sp. GX 14042]